MQCIQFLIGDLRLVHTREYYTDKNTVDRFLGQERRDDLEDAFVRTQVDMAASKVDELVRKYSDRPEFLNKVLSRLIDERLPKPQREFD
jgi:hypothetical protein